MSDREEIVELLHRYAWTYDDDDLDAFVDCWVEDGEMTVGGETVGSETVGSETVGDEKLTLPLADTLGKALLTPPLTQPAARYPAARIARATPSVLVICRPLP